MIEISHSVSDGKHILTIMGHAGFSQHGTDIVCAGVSALTYALLQTLCDADSKGELHQFAYLFNNGVASIFAFPKDCSKIRIDAAVDTVMTGYHMIASAYPENVRLEKA